MQKILLVGSYWWYRMFLPKSDRDSVDWVVGPVDIASVVQQFDSALANSVSVNFAPQHLYNFSYDYDHTDLVGKHRLLAFTRAALKKPLLLGRLMNLSRGFLYVAQFGYLFDGVDSREFEFRFLKSKSKKIGIFWAGSEIRSPRLCSEMEHELGIPNIFSYIGQITPSFLTDTHENLVRRRAEVGDRYADIMFDSPTDQRNYLTSHREPNVFLMRPEKFVQGRDKFANISTLVITHASTSPIIKGTQLVRAAIAKLRDEGYDFEYIELIRLSHEQVMQAIERSHIALNHFYGFTTSVFGVEAMAAHCAVLSSTDETIETSLPPGANTATFVTKHWQVYDHLKLLLDDPERLELQADSGRAWAQQFASVEITGPRVEAVLSTVLDGSYDPVARAKLSNAQRHGV